MDIIKLLTSAIDAIIDAKTAGDAVTQAAALAELDAALSLVAGAKSTFLDELAAGKTEAAEALHKKFHPDDTKPE